MKRYTFVRDKDILSDFQIEHLSGLVADNALCEWTCY